MLSELVENADIQGFGVAATLLFVAVFVAVVTRVLTRSRAEVERQAALPLDDGTPHNTDRSEGGSP
jgi:hypothetical protein